MRPQTLPAKLVLNKPAPGFGTQCTGCQLLYLALPGYCLGTRRRVCQVKVSKLQSAVLMAVVEAAPAMSFLSFSGWRSAGAVSAPWWAEPRFDAYV